jgi:hypothetical protein
MVLEAGLDATTNSAPRKQSVHTSMSVNIACMLLNLPLKVGITVLCINIGCRHSSHCSCFLHYDIHYLPFWIPDYEQCLRSDPP